jgi:hypothetical protein
LVADETPPTGESRAGPARFPAFSGLQRNPSLGVAIGGDSPLLQKNVTSEGKPAMNDFSNGRAR